MMSEPMTAVSPLVDSDRKLSIFFILTQPCNPQTGGVQMSTHKMGTYFHSRGHAVHVYSFSKDRHAVMGYGKLFHPRSRSGVCAENLQHLSEKLDAVRPDIVVHQTPYEFSVSELLSEKKRTLRFVSFACLRNSLFSVKLNIDDYRRTLIPANMAPLTRNPLGNWVLQTVHKNRHAQHLRKILETHDRFVLFGPPNLDEFRYFIPNGYGDQLAFVPNSIPSVHSRVPPKKKVLLYVGRLAVKQKQAELLLPLWKKVRSQMREWEFWVVGDGPFRQPMEEFVSREGWCDVKFFGRCDPYPFYDESAMTLMTSSFEGFPNVVIEAQSRASVPVLFNSFPLASWVVNHKKDGILVADQNLDGMASEIMSLASDDQSRLAMQEKALENARRFEINTVGQMWVELFRECLGSQ